MPEGGTWSGLGALGPGWTLYVGAVGATGDHAHHAVQVLVADTPVTLRDAAGHRHRCRAATIPPNAPHGITEGSPRAVMVLLDPVSAAGRAAAHRSTADARTWGAPWLPEVADLVPGRDVDPPAVVTRLRTALTGAASPPNPAVHPALTKAMAHLPTVLDRTVRLTEVSAEVGLSPGRLRHLFTAELGLPFRRYVLWLRLQRALRCAATGASLTEAAHAAGFADSSHLTHVTRRMFGLAPSELARAVQPVG